ncbi:MAG TPA: hypothetical protein DEQ80_08930 [Anaerolinea thermolimosa]|mgnify:CR=1 FL=1|uniref:Glycosyltransferase RgtA/B/C/D-like domain-containing protein n=1 Tax=Anaerolinea thermolimosa TaxID=229919 RepID=A0A3D1JHB3_9CHLR|nr:hypothetical protein [Anaerolinea thermolimosa]GAP07745.1 hypothetical protein ATHL_02632 [Anaerolinea thermolimosa]HCE17969.1 hypothetical protein [Anaerolinea thermolimosa]
MVKKDTALIGLFVLVILFGLMGDLGKIMTSLNRNEHMYITAGVLVSQDKVLYRDFAFLQMPYLPLLYAGLFKVFGLESYYLLTGKIVSFLALIAAGAAVFFLSKRVLSSRLLAFGLAALFVMNLTIVIPSREVSNYITPLALSLWAVYFFHLSLTSSRYARLLTGFSGFLVALAVGSRLTYLPIVLPFAIVLGLYSLGQKDGRLSVLVARLASFTAGLLIGWLPVIGFLFSDPTSFMFNNLGYHRLNTQWRFLTGYTDAMSLSSKIFFGVEIFLRPENLMLLIAIVLGGVFTIREAWLSKQVPYGLVLGSLLLITSLVMAVSPTPSFVQYYAQPVGLLYPLLVFSWSARADYLNSFRRITLFIMVMIVLMLNGSSQLESILQLSQREQWSGLLVRDLSIEIRNHLSTHTGCSAGKVATLSPLFALETGLSIYEELATGPFLYRVGDLLTPAERSYFIGTSPKTLSGLFDNDPPLAILTGFEAELEDPFVRYAEENDYRRVELSKNRGALFICPSCACTSSSKSMHRP